MPRPNHPIERKKRYALTLLEIMVAFFLVGILFSTLWGLYHNWLITFQKNQKSQMQIHRIIFLKERLDKIANLVAAPASEEEQTNFLFTPSEKAEGIPTLCFSYRNEPDPDPSFNGRVRSLLYLSSIKQLCLATWSAEKQLRIDILLEPILSFSLSYFDPQTNFWREDWPETFHHLPVWMRLKTEGDQQIELLFRFDHSFEPILYVGEK